VGFLLLIPPLRRLLIARFVHIVPYHKPTGQEKDGPRIIEGDYRREKD
jgi:UPF0716 protein FxsA